MDFSKYVNFSFFISIFLLCLITGYTSELSAQSDVAAWGNIRGIRVEGELMKFETSLLVVKKDWTDLIQTAKEKQEPNFKREDSKVTVTSVLENLAFTEIIKDSGKGIAKVHYDLSADSSVLMKGAFFCIELPTNEYSNAQINYIDQVKDSAVASSKPDSRPFWERFRPIPVEAKGIKIKTKNREFEIDADRTTEILVQKPNPFFGGNTRIYFTIISGDAQKGEKANASYTLKISGSIDNAPIELSLDASNPGRVFDGIGGNFRIQNPQIDPTVIDYCLKNLNVAWGRVDMPWFNWQPDESVDPIEAAKAGDISPRVVSAMEMAQRLSKKNLPLIISAWFPPAWAVNGDMGFRRQPGEPRGNPLNPMKMRSIEKSIGSYLIYLKEKYGVEPELFSFNESDLGIKCSSNR